MPFCSKCGTEVPENTNFCQKCGEGQKETNPSGKMHKQRLAIAICAAIGIFAVCMNWVSSPLKNLNGWQCGGWVSVALFAVSIAIAFRGDRTKPIWMQKGLISNKSLDKIIKRILGPLGILLNFRTNPLVNIASAINIIAAACYWLPILGHMCKQVGKEKLVCLNYSMEFGYFLLIIAIIGTLLLSFEGIAKKLFGNDGFNTETLTSNKGE